MSRSERTTTPSWPSRTATLLFVVSICWTVNQTTDPWHGLSREDLHFVGNVREVLVEEADIFSSSSGSREGVRSRVEWIAFDEDGRVTERIEFDRSGDPESTRRYTYADGLLILEEEYRRTRWPHETVAYTHEEDGRRTAAQVRTGDGTLRKTIVYERDEEGRLVSVIECGPSGDEIARVTCTYGTDGKRADRYDPDGELASWSVETFDAGGRLVELSLYTSGSEDAPFTITYEYDSHGNVTLEETSGRPAMPFVITTSTSPETKTSYEYTVDDEGNWIKRVKSVWASSADVPYWRAATATYRSIRYDG